ncbi:HAD family hydrolase [Cyanobium sp. CH-040]|uniref:HAD family hydrolase n=1 Tax=Cyanobium sp. CH-040 TaxID=2823708 RepID=UPI0020CD412F|nr:HAD-IA family hydrolase [Cyanobium sp. CH-040]MCP9929116.1 HAD-IA family hydrolase [Cyanobium sp. CH-040]
MAQLLLRGELLRYGVSAVLFDKDGTLCRSEPMLLALAQARVFHCRQLLQERHPELAHEVLADLGPRLEATYGVEENGIHPAGTTAVASREHNLISTATALAQLGLGWPEALELAAEVFERSDRLLARDGTPAPRATPGLHELIHRLGGAGVACAVISNDERQGIEAFLGSENLRSHFQVLRSAGDAPRKPHPDAVIAVCGELGVAPGGCALIGDANSDLVMAERAGVAVVLGYSAGWRRRPPLASRFRQLSHWQELEVVSA